MACEPCWFDMSHTHTHTHTHKWQHLLPTFKTFSILATCFQLLWKVIKRELQCYDQRALEITQQRVVKAMPAETSEALLQVDEAMEVIEAVEVLRPEKSLLRSSESSRVLNLALF